MARPAILYQNPTWMLGVSGRFLILLSLFVVIGFMTAYPIGRLIINSFVVSQLGEPTAWGLGSWQAAFDDPSLAKALGNTFFLGIARTVVSSVLAIYFAWVVTRTNTPYKGLIEFMLWLGFFLPFLPITIGWILLLDPKYGLVNKFLMTTFNLSSAPLNIYSYGGIIWAHLAFSTSIRFLLITPAFRAMDATLEEAARTLGSDSFGVLRKVTIPILLPAILAATSLGFIKSLESIEIELLLGAPAGIYVYSTKIWEYLRWEPPLYGQATALSSLFLVVILVMVWGQRALLGQREFTTISGRGYLARATDLGHWRWVTFSSCALFTVIMIVLPLTVLILGTFMRIFGYFDLANPWTLQNWTRAFDDPIFLRSLRNTVLLGVGVAVVGALFYAVVSYALIRMRFFGRGVLDFLSWLPWALPGVLIGLALLWVFLGSGPLLRPLYGTLPLMVLAIIIGSMPLGVQMLKAAMRQMGNELEESSRVLGASGLYTFRRIVLPLLRPAIMVVGLVGFITAVREIPTVMFLSSFSSRPISLLMLDYLVGGRKEQASVIGVFIVVLIIVAALIGRKLGMTMGISDRQ
jgi:iron(III) transport system permease protein